MLLFAAICFQSPITNHQSPITNHQSPITNHQSPITNHQSPITNHQSPITRRYCASCARGIQYILYIITNYPPLLRVLRPRHTVHPVHNHELRITNHEFYCLRQPFAQCNANLFLFFREINICTLSGSMAGAVRCTAGSCRQ